MANEELIDELIAFRDRLCLAGDVWRVVISILGFRLDVVANFDQWSEDAYTDLTDVTDHEDTSAAERADALRRLAVLDEYAGNVDLASMRLSESIELLDHIGEVDGVRLSDAHGRIVARYESGCLLRRDGQWSQAAVQLGAAFDQTNVGFTHGRALAAAELMTAALLGGHAYDGLETAHKAAEHVYYSAFATHRARALLALADGDDTQALDELQASAEVLKHHRELERFRLTLELIACHYSLARVYELSDDRSAVEQWLAALRYVEELPAGWRFSHGDQSDPLSRPFAEVFHAAARCAARSGDAEAALQIIEQAKQSGFAGLMRSRRDALDHEGHRLVTGFLDEQTALENDTVLGRVSDEALKASRRSVADAVGELFAAFYLPTQVDTEQIMAGLGGRAAIDFLVLAHDDHRFEAVAVGIATNRRLSVWHVEVEEADVLEILGDPNSAMHDDLFLKWAAMGNALLPEGLELLSLNRGVSRSTLVICPDGALTALPWAGLVVEDEHLIAHAHVAVAPTLDVLGHPPRLPVATTQSTFGVFIEYAGKDVLDYQHETPMFPNGYVTTIEELCAELDGTGPGHHIAYIAGHGEGTGFEQQVLGSAPEVRLDAIRALGLRWPPLVVLATCWTGQLDLAVGAIPFGLPIAVLAGGAATVLAAVQQTADRETGQILAAVLEDVRTGGEPVHALAEAQRGSSDLPLVHWAAVQCIITS